MNRENVICSFDGFLTPHLSYRNQSIYNFETKKMNSSVSNTSTPSTSEECTATIIEYSRTCSAEVQEIRNSVAKELLDCYFARCMEPARDCQLESIPNNQRETFTKRISECDALLASSGSTDTTNTGNGASTNTTTRGNGKNDTPAASAGFSVQGSLFSILAFALFL